MEHRDRPSRTKWSFLQLTTPPTAIHPRRFSTVRFCDRVTRSRSASLLSRVPNSLSSRTRQPARIVVSELDVPLLLSFVGTGRGNLETEEKKNAARTQIFVRFILYTVSVNFLNILRAMYLGIDRADERLERIDQTRLRAIIAFSGGYKVFQNNFSRFCVLSVG